MTPDTSETLLRQPEMILRRHLERLRCSGSARPRCVGAHLLSQGPARPLSRRAGGSDGRRLAAVGDQARVRLPDRRAARVRVPPEAVPHPRGPARLRLMGLPRHGRRDAGAGGGGDEESTKGGESRLRPIACRAGGGGVDGRVAGRRNVGRGGRLPRRRAGEDDEPASSSAVCSSRRGVD